MVAEDSDLLVFQEEDEEEKKETDRNGSWKIMIVDDEEDVHKMTKMALNTVSFAGKNLEFISAYTAREARELLKSNTDIALVLLDVVMETDDAGLKLVLYIREEQENQIVRIILRTGQPGSAPEKKVIVDYDINDYKAKTELTSQKMFTSVISSLRSYSTITELVERERSEQEMKKAKEVAEKATKLKNEFVNLVAHDLKHPFASILGFLELILDDKECPIPPKHAEFLGIVKKSSESLITMIDKLLDLGRMSTGEVAVFKEHLDGHELTSAVVGRLRQMASKKGIEIVNEVKSEKLYVDRELFGSVVHNLTSNAIKFSKSDSRVIIYNPETMPATIAVKDAGTGINERILPNLFKQEVKTTTKGTAGERGTGLGLPYCKKIMDAHGGSLTVKTTHGEGTVFYATLPEAKVEAQIQVQQPDRLSS